MATIDTRNRLVLALDVDTADEARTRAGALQEWFGIVKVGLELFTRCGPEIVQQLRSDGFEIFLDLKLHDIPTTVRNAAASIAALDVRFTTFHATGGAAMLRAGLVGLADGTHPGSRRPMGLAVTVLTSDTDTTAFATRLATAREAGMPGIVCSAQELSQVQSVDTGLITMVPGVRLAGARLDDQARVAAPGDAIRSGASCLVIGRTVTAAADPRAAAIAVTAEVELALSGA